LILKFDSRRQKFICSLTSDRRSGKDRRTGKDRRKGVGSKR
jgi:hypothetical protein